MRTWSFTETEFAVLWRDAVGDQLPAPFLFTSAAPNQATFRAEQEAAREIARDKDSRDIATILDTMSEPDLHLSVYGGDHADPMQPGSIIRVLAVRRRERGFLITQSPGKSYFHRGGYTVNECDPLRLADELVDALPAADPGSLGEIALAASGDDLADERHRSPVALRENSTAYRSARFLRAPTTISGEIEITQGSSVFGPRGINRHTVHWRDVVGDGRYVIIGRNAMAADSKQFAAVLNSRIAIVIRAIKEEREHIH
ncbi:ESX secretion-associated protein EspG [Nocardia uniformis]|uniref:ESX secretion-associated protein EspG n=1 Tax=Nocardia uniformis TaxID=53432 RepID=A0A849BYR8_9NOCA|nr:ESX secretion-associated protein EspG [Nocardia uniformis]NNH70266.1 ESX secretion-associated protein EspG [Nocardia uniformis]